MEQEEEEYNLKFSVVWHFFSQKLSISISKAAPVETKGLPEKLHTYYNIRSHMPEDTSSQ
jgi:hypothetical protein